MLVKILRILGKTHLLHAIGNDSKKKDKAARILYMGIDDYIREFLLFYHIIILHTAILVSTQSKLSQA
ncbi:MAG: hypothetical protein FIA99_05715 [Ruminiclostridium sp.]|nr:hypothetical protein [Ruminiclostridium sp.]